MSPQRPAHLSLGVLAGLALTASFAWRFNFLVDDAFISFRYARHLARGHGLVWNLGETPPVEGFSNFLWVALCALFERVAIAPSIGARWVSVAAALWLTFSVARAAALRTPAGSGVAAWSAAFLATLPPIGAWATGGLETMAFAASVFGCFEALTRPAGEHSTRKSCAWASLAVLLRADGFVWIGMALAAAGAARWLDARRTEPHERRIRSLRSALVALGPPALAAALVAGAYVGWRHSYFGEWGPNTARVKVHLDAQALERGAKYVASLGLAVLSIPLALLGAAYALRRDATGLAAPALVFVLASASYVALVGGDWMMMHRMLTPALPFVALAFAAFLGALPARGIRAAAGASALLLGVLPSFDVHLAPRALREKAHFRWGQDYRTEYEVWRKGVVDIAEWIAIGRALALFTAPGESMVLGNIGAFGYFPENLVVYDTHGLTNKARLKPADPGARGMPGHDFKVDMAEFEALRPTYLNARIVPSSDPYAVIPQKWRTLDPDGRVTPNEETLARFDLQLHALPSEQGFEPGTSLLLIRHRR